jgi:carboxyl-terminal processing protease
MKSSWYLLLAGSLLTFGCHKADVQAPTTTPTTTASQQDLLKDSVYLYTKETYLWQDVIPAYAQFNPRQYTGATDQEAAQNVMDAIKKLQPLDRFSFVTTRAVSDGLESGQNLDYGFFVKAAYVDKAQPYDSAYWFVSYVYNNSPAASAGVQRGWILDKINGTSLRYDQPSVDILNNTFFGTTTTAAFSFIKADGSLQTSNVAKADFQANSILYKNVLSAGGKQVGYLVFNQFFGQPSRTELGQAFNYFQAQGINELVVDLRYNRGGSTETQDTLANLIAPTSANNQKMYTYIFNSTLQNNQHQLIRNKLGYGDVFSPAANTVNFQKAGGLNLSRVFFIVSGSTASASELLINNLKPYMDVKLIGDKTYGKPVGFFPIPVYDLDIYPISFKTVNSAGNADYYSGFTPDKSASDGVNNAWGDIHEPCLSAALNYISTGTFGRYATTDDIRMQAQSQAAGLNATLGEGKFTGMFVKRK